MTRYPRAAIGIIADLRALTILTILKIYFA